MVVRLGPFWFCGGEREKTIYSLVSQYHIILLLPDILTDNSPSPPLLLRLGSTSQVTLQTQVASYPSLICLNQYESILFRTPSIICIKRSRRTTHIHKRMNVLIWYVVSYAVSKTSTDHSRYFHFPLYM